MCNCFLGNAENFIFDPKCKPSDTPDCDWHDSQGFPTRVTKAYDLAQTYNIDGTGVPRSHQNISNH